MVTSWVVYIARASLRRSKLWSLWWLAVPELLSYTRTVRSLGLRARQGEEVAVANGVGNHKNSKDRTEKTEMVVYSWFSMPWLL